MTVLDREIHFISVRLHIFEFFFLFNPLFLNTNHLSQPSSRHCKSEDSSVIPVALPPKWPIGHLVLKSETYQLNLRDVIKLNRNLRQLMEIKLLLAGMKARQYNQCYGYWLKIIFDLFRLYLIEVLYK